MLDCDFDAVPAAQMFCQLLRQIYGAVLASSASERHHQIFETATLIAGHASIDQCNDAPKKLMNALLLHQVIDDGGVFAGEALETFLTPRVREAACVKNESASVTRLVFGRSFME